MEHTSSSPCTCKPSYHHQALETLLLQYDMDLAHIWTAHQANHIYAEDGKHISYDRLIKGDDKERWLTSSANEFGRLMQSRVSVVEMAYDLFYKIICFIKWYQHIYIYNNNNSLITKY